MMHFADDAKGWKRFLLLVSMLALVIGMSIAYAPDALAKHGTPQCSDGRDNPDPEDKLADKDDPGCHTDGDATDGDDTYDPNDTDERNKPECMDDRDNADPDSVADADDPGCHTDFDPDDGDDTYNPFDPSEGGEPECSDGVDNADPDSVADADDPGCHTDGDPNNPDSYDPSDPSETGGEPECSDGVDNADPDSVADADDPGCHTDFDPNDGDDTYDPTDPSEGGEPECSDGVDNGDLDEVADEDDPGCHTDGDPTDGDDTYDPADPSEQDEGNFTCRASALRVDNYPDPLNLVLGEPPFEPTVANPDGDPCATDHQQELDPPTVGGVDANGLVADTAAPGSAEASAATATITVGTTTITADVIHSEATANCGADGRTRTTSGSSYVATVTLPVVGTVPVGTAHQDIAIPGVGTLHLNESRETTTGTGNDRDQVRTQRAIWLEITNSTLIAQGIGDVIVAESIADIHGNPCD